MITDISIHKPAPILPIKKMHFFDKNANILDTIKILETGFPVLITSFYSNGLTLLKEVQMYLKRRLPNKTFQEQREFRAAYRRLSNLVLIEIVDHKIVANKSPSIGWLEKLYSEEANHFLLTFPQVQGLNSSWQWYKNGITTPVLRNKIHPYYGTYFPTRFDHLILFDNWLKRYTGPKKSAIDVGTGTGILSFQMVKHGFQKVFGTDSNPNAIEGLRVNMGETKLSRKIELDFGHLFGVWEKQTELIVFNPPWLPQTTDNDKNDKAIYYDENLFSEFFREAKKRLLPDGKLLIMFSNLAEITNVTSHHPIEKEIADGGRFKLDICLKRPVKSASDKTNRDQHWRALEEVQLWILSNK